MATIERQIKTGAQRLALDQWVKVDGHGAVIVQVRRRKKFARRYLVAWNGYDEWAWLRRDQLVVP